MKDLFFSADGRVNRARFWMVMLCYVGFFALYAAALFVLWQIIPGEVSPEGDFNVSGVAAIPYVVLSLGFIVASFWLCLCAGIKRFHDRNKSGFWVLIQFVPVIGSLWYFIEVGCLKGTAGPNKYGADPLSV